jgi:3-oxoacyl-[acyl-carrier protein] reductase
VTTAIPQYPPGKDLLAGKTVLITAAAGTGIGFATAKRCLEEGARVMISDVHDRRLGEAADALAQVRGERPPTLRCDVSVESDVQALWEKAAIELGGVDILVNNAGLGGTAPLIEMTDMPTDGCRSRRR